MSSNAGVTVRSIPEREADLCAAGEAWHSVIASVARRRALHLRSWRLGGGRFLEERIEA